MSLYYLFSSREAPVQRKLCMPSDHEGQDDVLMEPGEHMSQQISYHGVVLILTPTVVSMEVDVQLTKPMYFEEVMEHSDDGVRSLANVN